MEIVSKSESDTGDFATRFLAGLLPNPTGALVIGLYGELGSGKTTFMKYFGEALGVKEAIQSPTFVIIKSFNLSMFQSFNKLVHIDAYRLDSGSDLSKLGWQEIISDPNTIVCIEWPERVAEIMPRHIVLKFEHGEGEKERKISVA